MKYDDASWHYGGDFPTELPPEAGATHMGMLIAWLFLSGFSNQEDPIDFEALTSRKQTPGQFVMNELDEKFVDLFFSEEGNDFAAFYYGNADGAYMKDYARILVKSLPSPYHVADTWENYDLLKPVIDERYAEWKSKNPQGSSLVKRLFSRFSKKG